MIFRANYHYHAFDDNENSTSKRPFRLTIGLNENDDSKVTPLFETDTTVIDRDIPIAMRKPPIVRFSSWAYDEDVIAYEMANIASDYLDNLRNEIAPKKRHLYEELDEL